jgi:glucose-6-phosphate 1-dehydrogenase
MATYTLPDTTVMVIFGGAGDLAWRKLVPSLFSLYVDKRLAQNFAVVGVDVKPLSDGEYHRRLREGVDKFSRRAGSAAEVWTDFTSHLFYLAGDFKNAETYMELTEKLADLDKSWRGKANHIFYLAVPPGLIPPITNNLGKTGLTDDRRRDRIIVEKPFGRDLETAQVLNCILAGVFDESQIYRIDHFLGKETVQNILAFRFANSLFEPIWDRRYIDNIQITVAEQLGVEHRGQYYENAGALRDMVQNHLLQILCMVAMEPPVSFKADEIRNKKVDVLRSIRPIPKDRINEFAVRGQYGVGKIDGKEVIAYRSEPAVDPKSSIETYVAVKFYVDNWRWQDIPFYLRTGKRMSAEVSEVSINFHPAPHHPFPTTACENWLPNRLVIRIHPQEGIALQFQAKYPGQPMRLVPVNMRFDYYGTFKTPPPEAYEILLLDVMLGDPTLFMRSDQIEAAWSVVTTVLEAWENVSAPEFPNYASGSWGPPETDALLAGDGRHWLTPMNMTAGPEGK